MTKNKDKNVNLKPGFFSKIRTYFLTGIVVAAPITVTGWVAIWFVQAVDGWFSPFAPKGYNDLPFSIPGLGIISAFIILISKVNKNKKINSNSFHFNDSVLLVIFIFQIHNTYR